MGAQLVGAARDRHKTHPRSPRADIFDHRIIGGGALGARCAVDLIRVDAVHFFARAIRPMPRGFGKPVLDSADTLRQAARHQRPINLAGFAILQCFGQRFGGAASAGEQQHAGGIFIEAVHELWLFLFAEL